MGAPVFVLAGERAGRRAFETAHAFKLCVDPSLLVDTPEWDRLTVDERTMWRAVAKACIDWGNIEHQWPVKVDE